MKARSFMVFCCLYAGVIIGSVGLTGMNDYGFGITKERFSTAPDFSRGSAASSLYKAFPLEEARRILRKLEIHYTPKHRSWLNVAEIESKVMTRQCLLRRLETLEEVSSELATWQLDRKQLKAKINWQFITADATDIVQGMV